MFEELKSKALGWVVYSGSLDGRPCDLILWSDIGEFVDWLTGMESTYEGLSLGQLMSVMNYLLATTPRIAFIKAGDKEGLATVGGPDIGCKTCVMREGWRAKQPEGTDIYVELTSSLATVVETVLELEIR